MLSVGRIGFLAHANSLSVFGVRYEHVYRLVSDIGFLNSLFAGKDISATDDNGLRLRLRALRRLSMSQLAVGLGIFAVGMVSGAGLMLQLVASPTGIQGGIRSVW